MKIIIIGGSGFIGSKLSKELLRQGNSVISVDLVPSSVSGVAFVQGSYENKAPESSLLVNPDVVINLAGRSIIGSWNKEHKDSIYSSRIKTTHNLVSSFKNKNLCPKVFIQVSATGFYGSSGEETLSEGSVSKKNTYLAKVAYDWEKEGSFASRYGIRTIIVRQGNILGESGLLSSLKPFYIKGLGGPVGRGENWFPWMHIHDLVNLYIAVIKNDSFSGVVNAVAPEVVRYKEFSSQLARVLQKPHFLVIPKFIFRLKYKGFTDEITASQKVVSIRMWELRNHIAFNTLESALRDILKLWKKH
jgi:uncharacterized protein (TIGR01777 family)